MNLLDLTFKTPAENLALDEALLDAAEAGGAGEVLRFWEPQEHFVVVGYANKVDVEVNRAACEKMKVPILRRCTGGGTVLQGPGCLNYTLILKIENESQLATVPQTNCFIMKRQAAALRQLEKNVSIEGHTDLALGELKFSGNAQRRKRDFLIFHGTFLLDFDLDLIEKLLLKPSKEPDYRNGRSHREFLTNLNLSSEKIKGALREVWKVKDLAEKIPDAIPLAEEKYNRTEWNYKF